MKITQVAHMALSGTLPLIFVLNVFCSFQEINKLKPA